MSDPAKRTPASAELSSADERALDALLTAALSPQSETRDFTAAILARLETEAVRLQQAPAPPPPVAAPSNRPWALAAVAAALAASALLVLLPQQLRNDFLPLAQHEEGTENASGPQPPGPAAGTRADQPDPADPTAGEAAAAASKPARKPPLELSRDEPLVPPPAAETAEPLPAAVAHRDRLPAAPVVTAELADFNQQFIAYWDAIGVNPAPPIDQAAWAARIANRFGWQPEVASDEAASDFSSSENVFANPQASRELAVRLVDQLLGGLRPSGERREQLVQQAAEVIHRGGRFDRLLSKWVADKAWLDEVAQERKQDPALVGQWVASRVIGADVGCAQCHDSPIDSRFTQHDFWAMAAAFAPRGDKGDQPVFYELEDGRQRVAQPGIPQRWFGRSAQEDQAPPLAPPEQLGDLVEGSPQIARTLANHLWTIGFGMPLVAASSSPMAPPRDDALERALAMLGDRLLSNQFDIRAAVQWVIACEPMRRDVPVALAGQQWLVADEATLAEASLAQRAFAAAKVTLPQASRGQLLALLQSRSGLIPATLAAPDSMLAQPRLRSPQPPGKADGPRRASLSGARGATDPQVKEIDLQEYWWAQWLADREALRGGWLDSIQDADQQLQHAFYAAGYRHIGRDQLEKVKTLLEATDQSQQDRSETIAQIHWILQNSR